MESSVYLTLQSATYMEDVSGLRVIDNLVEGIVRNLSSLSPNGHTTSNGSRFHVDITSIRPRSNFDEFPCHFRVLFWCNFADRKIHTIYTYFFRCNFDDPKIHVISTYFFSMWFWWCKNLRCLHVLFSTKFWLAEIWRRFWFSCKLIKTFQEVFLC